MNYKEAIQALNEGKTLIEKEESPDEYFMEGGFLCHKIPGGLVHLCPGIWPEKLEVQPPLPSLNLEVGNFYRTRDGRKAWITIDTEEDFCYLILGESIFRYCTQNGNFFTDEDSNCDLVSEWEE